MPSTSWELALGSHAMKETVNRPGSVVCIRKGLYSLYIGEQLDIYAHGLNKKALGKVDRVLGIHQLTRRQIIAFYKLYTKKL